VGFSGSPSAVPEEEICALQNGLAQGVCAEPHPYLTAGRRVRVVRGPLEGAQGILLRKKNRVRVVISLDLIMRSISVEIDPAVLEPLNSQHRAPEVNGKAESFSFEKVDA